MRDVIQVDVLRHVHRTKNSVGYLCRLGDGNKHTRWWSQIEVG